MERKGSCRYIRSVKGRGEQLEIVRARESLEHRGSSDRRRHRNVVRDERNGTKNACRASPKELSVAVHRLRDIAIDDRYQNGGVGGQQ